MADEIVQKDDPVLRNTAKPLSRAEIESPKIKKLIAHMKKVLAREENGVGLAAPQVGQSLRLFIVSGKAFIADDEPEEGEKKAIPPDMVFINPEIIRTSKSKKEMAEGCLSVRGLYGAVKRHEKATVKALDEHGKPLTYHGNGLIAQIFQHECDHLEGILYTDKATKIETEEERKVRRAKTGASKAASHKKVSA